MDDIKSSEISRARDVLGLNDMGERPLAPTSRIEYFWRAEGFKPVVPIHGAAFIALGKSVDLGLVREALLSTTARHQALRSRLALQAGRPVIVEIAPDVPEIEVTSVRKSQITGYREGGEHSPVSEFVERPIDLLADSGFRCRAFQDEEGDITLGIVVHHYFGDGWSSQVFRREFNAFLGAGSGARPELGAVAPYTAFALAQRQALSTRLIAVLDYWHSQLRGIEPARLPYDHARTTNMEGRLYFDIPGEILAGLIEISRQTRAQLSVICLAALQITLAKWSGQRDIVTAVNCADRVRPEFTNTMGFLVACLPVRSELRDDITLAEFFKGVAKNLFDGFARRELSYELYDEIFSPPAPFSPMYFNFVPSQERMSPGHLKAAAAQTKPFVGSAQPQVKNRRDLYLMLIERADGMKGKLNYNLDRFSDQTAIEFGERLTQTLRQIAQSATDRRLADFLRP